MHRLVSFVPGYDACEKLHQSEKLHQRMSERLGPGSWSSSRSGFLRNVKMWRRLPGLDVVLLCGGRGRECHT